MWLDDNKGVKVVRATNGGFIIYHCVKKEPPPKRGKDGNFVESEYEDRTDVAGDFKSAIKIIERVLMSDNASDDDGDGDEYSDAFHEVSSDEDVSEA